MVGRVFLFLCLVLLACSNVHGGLRRDLQGGSSSGLSGLARLRLIVELSLSGTGSEFDDPDSYQSRALDFTLNTRGLVFGDADFLPYYSLACVFYATNGTHNKRTIAEFGEETPLAGWLNQDGWVTTQDKCSWFGIACDNSRTNVQVIVLAENGLHGIFPPEVQYLAPTLETIDLFNNFYLVADGDAGNAWIGQMSNLRELFVSFTSFEFDGLPSYWSDVPTLEQIDCANTFYGNGPISPEAFTNLPMLFWLDLGNNFYTSTIPPEITQLPSLTNFYIPNAEFVGVNQTLDFVPQMQVIEVLYMDNTPLLGSIPPAIGTKTDLIFLRLPSCNLNGEIPSELGLLGNSLRILWLFENNLVGTIPAQLGQLVFLEQLYVDGNPGLIGSVPSSVCFNRGPIGMLDVVGADCEAGGPISCSCCTCCGVNACAGITEA